MENSITINNQNVLVKQYKGQRVLTFKDIDTVHGRTDGTARKRFNDNKKHFVEGEDFYKIQPSEIRTVGIKSPNGGIIVTESGYLMLVKSFTDDLSWAVQRQLVNSYFKFKEIKKDKNPEPYIYFDKTYNGDPVLSLADVEHFTGAKRNTIMKAINCSCVEFFDYYLLRKKDLMKFKAENPKVNKLASELYIITKDGRKSICKFCKIKPELPSAFTTEVISCKEKKKEEYAVIIGNTRMQGMIKGIKRKLTAVEVLLDSCNRHNMSVNDVETIRQALRKVSDDLATDITVFSYEKYQTTTSFKF